MKLASLKSGRDGELIVVSKGLKQAVKATNIAPTMQALLDDWDTLAPQLESLSKALNDGKNVGAFELNMDTLAARLPVS